MKRHLLTKISLPLSLFTYIEGNDARIVLYITHIFSRLYNESIKKKKKSYKQHGAIFTYTL